MIVHNIFDFTYLYYKYKYALAGGRMRRLTCPVEWKGAVIEKDISIIYYCIKEIEAQRREWEDRDYAVVSSICFDMPSDRSKIEGGNDYKADRPNKLGDEDYEDIKFIERILSDAGHNTYRYENYEADDLVNHLAENYKDVFDYTIIYTPDKDLFINVDDKVGIKRFKVGHGYTAVGKKGYSEYLSAEFGCRIPYNAILLFLCTVGDKADHVKGINKFGPKAFDKMLTNMENENKIEWERCNNLTYMEEVLKIAAKYLKPEQAEQMFNSYKLVKPKELDVVLHAPDKKTTYEKRQAAYSPYSFTSLYQ